MTDIEYLFAAVIATYAVLAGYAFWIGNRSVDRSSRDVSKQ